MRPDEVAERAMRALRASDPREAKAELEELIAQNPEKIDLRHSLAIVLLKMGEAKAAHIISTDAIRLCFEKRDDTAATMLSPLYLVAAEALEELYLPLEAEKNYLSILEQEPEHPYARQRYSYLLLANGRIKEAQSQLETYLEYGLDEPDAIKAHEQLMETIKLYQSQDIHPKEFLHAHREAYVEAFDKIASKFERQGWSFETPIGRAAADGSDELLVPKGAPLYATARADAYNPENGQQARIGEGQHGGPYYVALADFEILSQMPFVDNWPGKAFSVYVSSMCAWNHLAIHIKMVNPNELQHLDAYIGDWYQAGFYGEFGDRQRTGMFHEIYNMEQIDEQTMMFYVDLGRARLEAITDFLNRLENLHNQYPIDSLLFGRGLL